MAGIGYNGGVDLQPLDLEEGRHFGYLVVQPTIISRILEAQKKDEGFQQWFSKVAAKEPDIWSIDSNGALRCIGRLCLPNME